MQTLQLRVLLLLFVFSSSLQGLDLRVRLFSVTEVKETIITTDAVDFCLLALDKDGTIVDTIYDVFAADSIRTFYLSNTMQGLRLKRGQEILGTYRKVLFKGLDSLQQFRISVNKKERAYYGDIEIENKSSKLLLINSVNLELYVAGVVESEAGHVPELEFYKAQAVLVRTFALRNLTKHAKEGYNLKDDVSSQVYHSKAHYTHKDLIEEAVALTRDTILVNSDCKPILSVFHANSGGYTVNSEDVWLRSIDYLKASEDSFSIGVGSYSWRKELSKEKYFSYFSRMLGVKNNAELQKAVLNLHQEGRDSHFKFKGKSLKLTKVRNDFRLKSTYFIGEVKGDKVILNGFGFGHGVGLSQDGAIAMSKSGFNYNKILRFYFKMVELESLNYSTRS
jgi:stage II sporulation protein D